MPPENNLNEILASGGGVLTILAYFWARISGAHKRISDSELDKAKNYFTKEEAVAVIRGSTGPMKEDITDIKKSVARIEDKLFKL